MSYFFPHDTREAKRKETVEVFNRHYQAIVDIEQRLLGEFQALTPLWEVLILIRMSSDREEVLGDWTYEEWSRIYTVNGWTEVQGEKWYQTKTKPISGDEDNLKFEGFEEQTLVEGSEHWNDFIKTIDGVEYRNSFPVDKQKYWQWLWWFNSKDSFERRLNLVIDSSYDVDCLEYYTSIYIHEAFLIMMGVSPDNMERTEFRRWVIDSMAIELNEADYYETKEDWFKKDFKEFKEWKILERQFGEGKSGLGIEIDTKEFTKWALKIGLIEEDTTHFRDGRLAPFEVSFTEMLHKELLAKKLIKQGKHHHTWQWASTKNAYSYLIRSLFINEMPKQYWIDEPLPEGSMKNNVRWEPWQHYFGTDITRPENQTTIPRNSPTIDLIVEKLFVEHDKGNINKIQYLD